jgi:choline dehydrogenase
VRLPGGRYRIGRRGVANRLSSDPATAVVALEAGPPDKNRFIPIPAAFSKLFRSEIDWDYLTEPQQQLDGHEIYWPRGKVLGGSSAMNAMMWVRGFAADYDEWAVRAGPQWSYADVLGYFRRIEDVSAAWHFVSGDDSGVTGPLQISRQRSPRVSTAAWLAATREFGFPPAQPKPNSPRPEGFCETVVTQHRGARFSTADAYLKPVMRRKTSPCSPVPPLPEWSSTDPARSASNSSGAVTNVSLMPVARWCSAAVPSTAPSC